jgi:hypothetical protein
MQFSEHFLTNWSKIRTVTQQADCFAIKHGGTKRLLIGLVEQPVLC